MAESTLSLTLDTLRDEIADYFSYGTGGNGDYSTAGDTEKAVVNRMIKRGLRLFMTPPVLQGDISAHRWSWLTPRTTITTFPVFSKVVTGLPVKDNGTSTVTLSTADFLATHVGQVMTFATSGAAYVIASFTNTSVVVVTGDASGEASGDTITIDNDDLLLPDDFGGIEGDITFATAEGRPPILIVGEGRIRERRQYDTQADRPQIAAITPYTFTAATGQRWMLSLYPTPDQAYTLGYRYQRLFDMVAADGDFFWGGLPYGEAIIQACLAVSEQRRTGKRVYHNTLFMQAISAAVSHDRTTGPQHFGRNIDLSDDAGRIPTRSELRAVSYDSTLNNGSY